MDTELKAKIVKLEVKAAALQRRKKAILAAMSREERKRRTRAKIVLGALAAQHALQDSAVLTAMQHAVHYMCDRERDLVLSIYPQFKM